MSWMKTTVCPVCRADGFDPDCDEVDVGVGVQEGNLRGRCRVCGEVCERGDDEPGFVAEFPPNSFEAAVEAINSSDGEIKAGSIVDAHLELDGTRRPDGSLEMSGVSICPGADLDRPLRFVDDLDESGGDR